MLKSIFKLFSNHKAKINGSFEIVEYDESMDTDFFLLIKKHHKTAEKDKVPEYILRLLSISDSAFYGDNFWGMHLFDNTPDESVFKEQLNLIMPYLEKIQKYQKEKYEYFYEYYLEKEDLLPFKNFDEYISHCFTNDIEIKNDIDFVIHWREKLALQN